MAAQTNVPPPVLLEQELFELEQRVWECLDRLGNLGIPDALGHFDVNPGNIVISRECAFLDWAEAYVGSPFFTFEYLLEHFRRTLPADSALEDRFARAYLAKWHDILPPKVINEGLQLASLAAVFAFAVGGLRWRDPERLNDGFSAGYVRALARRMYREATQFMRRGALCHRS